MLVPSAPLGLPLGPLGRLCTVDNMREAGLRLGDAAQLVKLLRDNPYVAQSAVSPEPSGVSLGSVDSFSQDTQLLEEEGDEEVVVASSVLQQVGSAAQGASGGQALLHTSQAQGSLPEVMLSQGDSRATTVSDASQILSELSGHLQARHSPKSIKLQSRSV